MTKAKEAREETRREQQGQPGAMPSQLTRRESYAPTRWTDNPFSTMNRFADEMERIFSDFGFGRNWLGSSGWGEAEQARWTPQVEIFEREGKFIVRADLPGLNKEDVKVNLTDNTLTIQGERKQEHQENRAGWHRSERSYGSFYRAIPLPEGINAEQAQATFRDGVLEISMAAPQREERRSRQIEIK